PPLPVAANARGFAAPCQDRGVAPAAPSHRSHASSGDPATGAPLAKGMPMRTLFTGGLLFDGTGDQPRPADVVIEGGRIVDVGTGLDGDVAVDCTGRTILPGLFDCHVHLLMDGLDPTWWRRRP